MESTLCYTIMDELENWSYYVGSDQTTTYKIPQTRPNIYCQSKTSYEKLLKIHSDFDWWYCHQPDIQHNLLQWGAHHNIFLDNCPHKSWGGSTILIWGCILKPTLGINKIENYFMQILRPIKTESDEQELKNIGYKCQDNS